MERFALLAGVLLWSGCEKKTPRHEGPLRVQLGDCAEDGVWVSGPRPEDPSTRAARRDAAPTKATPTDDPPPANAGGDPAIDRQKAIEQARQAGVLETISEDGAFTTLTGGADTAGGGAGWGTIGTGRYGTIGDGSGAGPGGARRAAVPTVSIGQPDVRGQLDKAIIRRYIKRNVQKIEYCYEKRLLDKPDLQGTVTTQFTIKPDGIVGTSTASGVDREVADCVATVIRGIEFPKPKGGGGVEATYPFTFRPGEGARTTSAQPPPTPTQDEPARPEPAKPAGNAAATAPYTPGATNPLRAQKDALEECFRGNAKPYGAVTVKLDWTGNAVRAASVNGVDDGVATCVAEAARKLTRREGAAASQTCAVAFGTMPIGELPSIEITADAIKLGGAPITTPQAVTADGMAFKIDALYRELDAKMKSEAATTQPVSIVGPIVIRPVDTAPIAVVNRVIATTLAAGGNFVLAASDGPSWRMLHDVEVPVVPVPRGTGGLWATRTRRGLDDTESVTLSILVQKDQIWVGLSRVNEFQQIPALSTKELDWEKLQMTLEQHKRSAFFEGRADLELGGEDVTWRDIVRVIEIAKKVGFHEFVVVDPAGLSARPTL